MRSVLVAALVSLLVSILCTPLAIRLFRREGLGQAIRDDGPQSHIAKRGTPTMGGTVIIIATLIGYFASHLFSSGSGPSATGLLLLYLFTGMGVVGFLDDFIKVRKQRSLGLSATAKLICGMSRTYDRCTEAGLSPEPSLNCSASTANEIPIANCPISFAVADRPRLRCLRTLMKSSRKPTTPMPVNR